MKRNADIGFLTHLSLFSSIVDNRHSNPSQPEAIDDLLLEITPGFPTSGMLVFILDTQDIRLLVELHGLIKVIRAGLIPLTIAFE